MQYKINKDDYIHGGIQKDFYGTEEVESCVCMICGSNDNKTIYTECGNLGIVKCSDCNFVYTNPRAKNAEGNYSGDAGVYFNEARLIFNGRKKHHRDKNYEYELLQIKKIKPGGKLLDIGTNMGFFLRKAREFGYETQGVEPSPSLCKIAKEQFELSIKNSFLENAGFPENHFDVITMIDVFEHVTNPVEILNHIHSTLKEDGILCIKVPNGNYNLSKLKLAKMFGRENQHDIFNSYEHVGHYTRESMNKILQNSQFQIIDLFIPLPIHPPIWANLVGHYYQYPSPIILDWKRIFLRNLFWWAGRLENLLGLNISLAPDLMFIVCKK